MIGILAAALLQYVTSIQYETGQQAIYEVVSVFTLGITTVPFVILIPIWMIKELLRIRRISKWSIRLTLLCWDLWGCLLFVYLVNLFALFPYLPREPMIAVAYFAGLIPMIVMALAYKETASDSREILYFESALGKIEILLLVAFSFIITAVLIYLFLVPPLLSLGSA